MEERLGAPGIIFIIIHGTASNRARWIRPDSKIRRRLERHFNRRGHTVSFEWTGANTDAARLTAARGLARRILELSEEFHAPIYLVAHSHGGIIALYSMREAAVEAKVAGVICMGSLFIKCRPRPLIPAIEKCLGLLPRLAGTTVLGVIALIRFTEMGGGVGAAFSHSAGWYPILLPACAAASRKLWMPWYKQTCDRWVASLRGYVEPRTDSTIAALSLPRLPNLKMLSLWSRNDEVSKCLRLSIFLSELPFFAWRSLNGVGDLVLGSFSKNPCGVVYPWIHTDFRGFSKPLIFAFYTGVSAAIAGMLFGDQRIAWLHWLELLVIPRLAGLAVLIIAAPLLLVLQAILAVTPRLPGILSHGFGEASVYNRWFIRFAAELSPEEPNDCLVKEMNVVAGRLNFRAPNLRTFWAATAHTRLYNNPKVLREIMGWIYLQEENRAESKDGLPRLSRKVERPV